MREARNNKVHGHFRLLAVLLLVWLLAFFLSMPVHGATPNRGALIRQNFAAWQKLSAERQNELGDKFFRFLSLPAKARASVITRYQRFHALPEHERVKLHERFQKWRARPESERSQRLRLIQHD